MCCGSDNSSSTASLCFTHTLTQWRPMAETELMGGPILQSGIISTQHCSGKHCDMSVPVSSGIQICHTTCTCGRVGFFFFFTGEGLKAYAAGMDFTVVGGEVINLKSSKEQVPASCPCVGLVCPSCSSHSTRGPNYCRSPAVMRRGKPCGTARPPISFPFFYIPVSRSAG